MYGVLTFLPNQIFIYLSMEYIEDGRVPPSALVRIPLPLVQGKAGRQCSYGKRRWTARITGKWI